MINFDDLIPVIIIAIVGGLASNILTIPVLRVSLKGVWTEFNRHRDNKDIHYESEKPIEDIKEDVRRLESNL